MTQIMAALCVYLLLAYLKFQTRISKSLQQIIRLLQLNLFARRSVIEEFLGRAQSFSLNATATHDYMSAEGDLLESGSFRTFRMKRPNRLRVDLLRRNGVAIQLAANGKKINVMRVADGAYAQLDSAKTLDDVVDLLIAKIGTPAPLANLLYSDLWGILELRIDTASHVGEVKIEGVDCDHLLFSNDRLQH